MNDEQLYFQHTRAGFELAKKFLISINKFSNVSGSDGYSIIDYANELSERYQDHLPTCNHNELMFKNSFDDGSHQLVLLCKACGKEIPSRDVFRLNREYTITRRLL
jgi:hypothetical protein